MLTKPAVVADVAVLVVLVAWVLLFTDRSPFAWGLAGAIFASIAISGALARWYQAR